MSRIRFSDKPRAYVIVFGRLVRIPVWLARRLP